MIAAWLGDIAGPCVAVGGALAVLALLFAHRLDRPGVRWLPTYPTPPQPPKPVAPELIAEHVIRQLRRSEGIDANFVDPADELWVSAWYDVETHRFVVRVGPGTVAVPHGAEWWALDLDGVRVLVIDQVRGVRDRVRGARL